MTATVRLGDICTGHGDWPSRPSITASPNVYTDSIPVVRLLDAWAVHCDSQGSCHGGVSATGSSTVYANGKARCRIGDSVSCGSTMMTGSSTVFIG